ncbi:MAG TPA: hypothetical protein VI461_05780 [Chitinophagaceae bacterium]|nr:hypothetical protein [Chitinophagaceae bacterium]
MSFIYFQSYAQIKHFVFIGMDRDLMKDTGNWTSAVFDGVQVAYSWRQLETQKDKYDFSLINEDIELLKKYNKKLFIQLQDVSFSLKWNHAPKYLLADSIYHGGANKQYNFKDDDESEYSEAGWATRRWDPEVQKRLYKLYNALGRQFDGVIEGINLAETSVDFGKGPLHPPGFTFQRYTDATIENLTALKKAFPKSVVMVYANFMPGGYLPYNDSVYLKSVYDFVWQNNIATGGPDLFPWKRGQMNNSYGFIRDSYKKVPSALAVQDGNYEYINPRTKEKIKTEEIYLFAKDYLKLTYIFWGTEEPFFHTQTIPFLRSLTTTEKTQ